MLCTMPWCCARARASAQGREEEAGERREGGREIDGTAERPHGTGRGCAACSAACYRAARARTSSIISTKVPSVSGTALIRLISSAARSTSRDSARISARRYSS